ncbi:hypothetical protein [Stackebrandtia soli]|uniref:hypothetical protein n=1 Tax=Stackebrandtia soli TaxID=1892856 RepID=UPI0039E79A5A
MSLLGTIRTAAWPWRTTTMVPVRAGITTAPVDQGPYSSGEIFAVALAEAIAARPVDRADIEAQRTAIAALVAQLTVSRGGAR